MPEATFPSGVGAEVVCVAEHGGRRGEGKALLESDKLLFRGEFRLSVPLAGAKARAEGDALVVEWSEGRASFLVGAKRAATWAQKILHPPTRLDKAGVKPGTRVLLVGVEEKGFAAELRAAGAKVVREEAEMVFAQIDGPDGLGSVPKLAKGLPKDGALWILSPRGRPEIADVVVMAAARKAGLVDVKVMRFSDTHTALKFVWPASKRNR